MSKGDCEERYMYDPLGALGPTKQSIYNRDMSVQNNKMFDFKKPFCLAN